MKKTEACELFDPEWYSKKYPDVQLSGMDPLKHYLTYGWLLNRDPSAEFSGSCYLENYPDVKKANINPLIHYIQHGQHEGREKFRGLCSVVLVKPQVKQTHQKIILYHSHNLRWQGAQNSLFEIAKGTKDRAKFGVILTASDSGELSSAYEKEGIEFIPHPFPSRGVGHEKEMEKYISRLAEFYLKSGAKLIHANTLQNYFSILAAQKANLPILLNVRESEEPKTYFDYLPSYLRNRAFNSIASAESVVFVAESTMKLWKKHVSGDNFHLVRNGVDTNRLRLLVYGYDKAYARKSLRLTNDKLVVLNVGTFCERKNQMELLRAYKLILELRIFNIELILVGANNSEYSQQVANFRNKLQKMGGQIKIVNETNGQDGQNILARYYLASDVFTLCSLNESYPRVIMEAFAFGLPAVSSACFGTTEQIEHYQNGFLYESGNIEDLKDAILKLHEDRQLLEKMSNSARMNLRSANSYISMLQKYEQIYDQIMRQGDDTHAN